jgi:3-oxoacyl-[acyl-carrier-protein] synthase III
VYDREDLFEYLDNEQIVELSRLGNRPGFSSPENVLRSTGISTRRILKPNVTAADLAQAVCRRLEQESGRLLQDFSAVMLCHSDTDSAACKRLGDELCRRMNIPATAMMTFNFGCSGFLKLLHEGVLHLVGDESTSRVVLLNIETPEGWHDASDRLFCGIVGAGATGMILERGAGIPVVNVRSEDFLVPEHLRPNPAPLFHHETADVFSFRSEAVRRCVMRMNAEPVFLNGIELMLANLRSAVASIDLHPEKRVIVVPHQPSGKLLKALIAAARKEFPEFEYLNNLKAYGNTISSSVSTILSRLPEVLAANQQDPLRTGDHVILLAAGICMHEIENHMSAGHACLQWISSPQQLQTSTDFTLLNNTVPNL